MFLKRPLLLGTAMLGLVACNFNTAPPKPTPDYSSYLAGKDLNFFRTKLGDPQIKSVLVLHYHRFDNDYTKWDVWTWPEGKDGQAVLFTEDDKYGKIAIIGSREEPGKRGFIVRKDDWSEKDVSDDRYADIPASGLGEIWVVSGQKDFYTDPAKIDLSAKAQFSFLDSFNEIKLAYSNPPQDLTRDKISVMVAGVKQNIESLTLNGKTAVIKLSAALKATDIGKDVTISGPGIQGAMPVYARDVLSDPAFTYSGGDLGAMYTPAQTTFKVWTPVSTRVQVLLFNTAADTTPYKILELARGDKGVWSGSEAGDLAGKYYQLRATRYGVTKTTVDPYSKAASNYFENLPMDNSKSAIVNMSNTNPEAWTTYKIPTVGKRTDVSVYEVHVRDFTVSESSGVPAAKRGKYLGVVESGTKVPGTSYSTGLDHLKKLGVNTVQLLPVYDFGNEQEGAYNWGYDPYLYNVPEAQYSTQPGDPAATIREFKTMVKGLQDSGINVIMDVVYNHTKHTGEKSPFDQLVPYYYYRTSDAGTYLNDTGVGNVMAVERPMVKNFILDSLKYWVSEYHIQGFRFDLLGTFKKDVVQTITNELTAFKPDIVLYGEPWTGGGPTYFGKGDQKGMKMGVFNDNFRNGIIGGVFNIDDRGFIQGDFGRAAAIMTGLKGSIDDFTQEPGESTNYATSHDNYVLWDHLSMGITKDRPMASLKQMQKMAAALVFTAQGLPFMSGGEEFARTKKGNGNSYNAGDDINAFDWTRLEQFADVNAYYSNIIKLRADHPVFRLSTRAEVEGRFHALNLDGSKGLVGFVLDGSGLAGESWKHTLVIFNASETEQTVDLPEGTFRIHVRGDQFSNDTLATAAGKVTVPALSTLVASADMVTFQMPALPALKSALNLEAATLDEFSAESCSNDAYAGWGEGNALQKMCVAQDANHIYTAITYKTADNSMVQYLSLGEGGPVSDMNTLDAWPRKVKFSSVAPNFFIANYGTNLTPELRKVLADGKTELIGTETLKVFNTNGTLTLKAKLSRATLGNANKIRLAAVIVGGDNYGGGSILPGSGNTANPADSWAVNISNPLGFSY
ncbi:type I pullulanase [Deinococcus cellulosilyticus]|uniref:pullulanase n=1 Tax=Deinococcus cellulosilyticus (strain DSM 18568 / NBRC 106333 / KACC 11606 / 5516J-15) TaxID=1223518 RepID=A0A511N028_DEIC1|nr:type I pullulanase [Deinococcus cellulosilyticus]GEM46194.1 pullulanase [Deinococcus cellulosilyticus NBRC 106333 = KACC 11606]